MNFIHVNLIKTVIAILLVVAVDVAIEYFVLKRISYKRKKKKYKVLTRNILLISLIIFLAKIWIDGFGHLLAFIGFISAALTITQKENLLNLTGGLIIMWRDTFSEGDFVSIQTHQGVVKHMGIFYFTLEESSANSITIRTGKLVKIPNSFVSLYPFRVYSFDNFINLNRRYVFRFTSNVSKLKTFTADLQQDLADKVKYSMANLSSEESKEQAKLVAKNKFDHPATKIQLVQDSLRGYGLNISGSIPISAEQTITDFIENKIIAFAQENYIELVD